MRSTRQFGRLGLPAIVIHGGAGTFPDLSEEESALLLEALGTAREAGWEVLERGGSAYDAVVEAVASLEDSGRFNAGRGAVPTDDGAVEFDAGVMDAATGAVGALCAATYPANPVRAARAVAAVGGVPDGPVLLAGAGADDFCAKAGLEAMRPQWLTKGAGRAGPPSALSKEGTVGAVAVDRGGQVAAATSTGGRSGQRRGRVGDSPIPGAGVLAHRCGVAVSATGAGEAFLVAGFSHRVAWERQAGRPLHEAVEAALSAVGELGGTGGAVALSDAGEFVASFTTPAMARAWRGEGAREAYLLPG
ncbi:MAG TPA: isoaspartyl peptidase/L-asparaginase [Acidimicrobiales bacterium]|nr:isoaspartyl peptidase/L-asparaginase [Acidimicrobiales bacterium]